MNVKGKAMERKIILIVDDIELNRAILSELFCKDYEILEAGDGKQAIERIEMCGPSIVMILLDIIMPVKNGFDVLNYMIHKNLIKQIPVIMITAENSEDVLLKGYELGVSDIINKPFHPNVVRRRVENTIELCRHKLHLEKMVQRQTEKLREQAEELRRTNIFVIDALSTAIEFRDGGSARHIKRIRVITEVLLRAVIRMHPEYRLTHDQIPTIASAAAMHDIGKIAIPDHILNKPGRLTKEEFEIMKLHTVKGCELLRELNYMQDKTYFSYCYEICRHHHERWDGRGYPDQLSGDEIPIWSQVVSIADVYDALISERVYKPSYPHEQAVRMIVNGECGAFNPALIECFLSMESQLKSHVCAAACEALDTFSAERAPAIKLIEEDREAPVSERALRLLEMEREKYRILTELSGEIIFNYDIQADVMEFSEKYQAVFGGDIKLADAKNTLIASAFLHKDDKSVFWDALEKITPERPNCKMRLRLKNAAGDYEWYEVYVNALWDKDAAREICIGYLGKISNINALIMETNHWRHQANMDSLTGVYNRKALKELITKVLSAEPKAKSALAFIDIDDFKSINDSFGHLFGDQALQHISGEITANADENDIVGRVGGDEFILFLRNIASDEELGRRAEMLCEIFRKSDVKDRAALKISGSVGIARYPEDGDGYDVLLEKADQALYAAKLRGKDQYAIYGRADKDE